MPNRRKTMLPGLSTVGLRRPKRSVTKLAGYGTDTSRISYRAEGASINLDATGNGFIVRHYIPGFTTNELYTTAGSNVVANYQEAKFLPGTSIRWVPNVGTTVTGRVYTCFVTSPEQMASFDLLTDNSDRLDFVRGVGNTRSFPPWMETTIPVPTTLRRKMFNTNVTSSLSGISTLEQCCQVYMISVCVSGPANTNIGGFDCYDNVLMTGLSASGYTRGG